MGWHHEEKFIHQFTQNSISILVVDNLFVVRYVAYGMHNMHFHNRLKSHIYKIIESDQTFFLFLRSSESEHEVKAFEQLMCWKTVYGLRIA